jgi:hypothetical protein
MPTDLSIKVLDTVLLQSTAVDRRGKKDIMVRYRVNDGSLQTVTLPAETYTADLARQAIVAKVKEDAKRQHPGEFKVTL